MSRSGSLGRGKGLSFGEVSGATYVINHLPPQLWLYQEYPSSGEAGWHRVGLAIGVGRLFFSRTPPDTSGVTPKSSACSMRHHPLG